MTNSNMQYDAIVLGAGPNGLGVVRGLAEQGVRPCLIAFGDDDPSLHSRYPVRKHTLHGNKEEKQRQLLALLDDAAVGVVVIPTSDWFVAALASYCEQQPDRLRICMPPRPVTELLIDKALETARMSEVVPLPRTVQALPDTADELLEQLRLPIIFKPRSFAHNKLRQKTLQVWNEDELDAFYQTYADALDATIAQEIVPGEDSCLWVCNCTFNTEHQLADAFVFRRLGLSPAHYGVTSYAISEANAQVVIEAQKIGTALNYVGPAMIEFKYDERDGDYKYIELNPRLGMCNYFDTRCGVPNAYNTYRLAMGEALPAAPSDQRNGVIFVSAYEDLFSRRKDRQSWTSIFRTYTGDLFKPHVFIYFSWRDPVPAALQAWHNASEIGSSLLRKFRR